MRKKNMYGRTYWGIERSTFVVDQKGYLNAVFRKVKVEGHVDEVLAALQETPRPRKSPQSPKAMAKTTSKRAANKK